MLAPVFEGWTAVTGRDAIALMSGSAAPGITINGSSPGCQRSMPSSDAPSEELPKNRLAVLTEKPSRGGDGSTATTAVSAAPLGSLAGRVSSDIDASYCGSGGAFSASASSGSSGAGSLAG